MRSRLSLAALVALAMPVATHAADPAGDAFFEAKIRPVLLKHCAECHGADPKKLKGGFSLDTRNGLRKGGDSGPAIVPGKPAESLLVKALKYDELEMPPSGKLPEAVVADFERWVKMGAPDPRTGTSKAVQKGLSLEAGRQFWSYKPPVAATVPAVSDSAWPKNDIDRFILARLDREKLKPAGAASRATFARRLAFDLSGLPPTPEQIDAYVNDPSPDADAKLVDRLLASPEYGERWGRHWLDLARYGESLTLRGFILPSARRYRDYVIESFNADVPFDRFIREQIAGDLLPTTDLAEKRRRLAAVQFLLLGNSNLEEQDKKALEMDVIDEQLDVVSKAFLAQTVTCARCHDHKFDPIPTKDYYGLAGIFAGTKVLEHANVSKWVETAMPVEPAREGELRKHEVAVVALQTRIKELKAKTVGAKPAKANAAAKATMGDKPAKAGVMAVSELPGIVIDDAQAKAVGDWTTSTFSGSYIGSGYRHDGNAGKGEKTLTFEPELTEAGIYEVWLAYSQGKNRSDNVPFTVLSVEGEKVVQVDETKPPPIDGRFVSLGTYRFERGNQGHVILSNEGTKGHVTVDAIVFLPASKTQATAKPKSELAGNDELKTLEAELAKLQAAGPKRETVIGLSEQKPVDLKVHIRGSGANLGAVAPRGVLQVATLGPAPAMPADQSGRLQLADWIASPHNPLTARVVVNRVWHWMFGSGLVRTVDNFGTTGETPSHPELLDYLATRFVAEGWSVKKLVREIALSRTYRQDASNREATVRDPENRLLARSSRRRLDAEAIRDAILSVSGQLVTERGGPGYPATLASDFGYKSAESRKRSVYLPVFRNSLPQLFEAFDFADPSMPVGARTASIVAPQALYLMNHPFVLAQSKAAAERLSAETPAADDARATRAYQLALGRPPSASEIVAARKYAKDDLEALFQALFASVEFRYLQ